MALLFHIIYLPGIKAAWTLLYHNYCTMDPHTRKRHLIPDPSFSKTRIGIDMYIKNTLLILCYRLWIIWRWLFNWMTVWMRACICFVFLVMSMLFLTRHIYIIASFHVGFCLNTWKGRGRPARDPPNLSFLSILERLIGTR